MNETNTYLQFFALLPDQANAVSRMIEENPKFLGISVSINEDRETYPTPQTQRVPEGNCLVTLEIPSKCAEMTNFYREFHRAISAPQNCNI